MGDEERRHPQARRVADPEAARRLRRQRGGSFRRAGAGGVLGEIEAQQAREIDGEHLGLERQGEHAARAHRLEVAEAELAVAVHRGGAHEVADLGESRELRLATVRQTVHRVLEQPHALVRAREHQVEGVAPARFLQRDVLPVPREERLVHLGRGQHERGVPPRRDHPVGAFGRVERVREGDEPQLSGRSRDAIDDLAVPLRVEIEALAPDAPPLPCHAADEGARKAHPGGVECAHPRKAHHRRGDRNGAWGTWCASAAGRAPSGFIATTRCPTAPLRRRLAGGCGRRRR